MAEPVLERRVDRLEDLMADLIRESAQTHVEMRAFKDEMGAFKVEMRRAWGELSNRLGTMAEDLVAPSVPRILSTVIGCPEDRIDSVAVRVFRRSSVDPSRSQEFDVVAVCGEHVLVNETKSRLAPGDVEDFVALLATAREYLPDAQGRKIIGAIASLYVDASLVAYAEKQGLIVLGFGQDVMDVLNSPGFAPKTF
jgi:hypothetical protein